MKSPQLNRSRFIVGIILIVIAVLIFLFVKGDYSTTGAIGIGILGLVSIAISMKQIAHSRPLNRWLSRPPSALVCVAAVGRQRWLPESVILL